MHTVMDEETITELLSILKTLYMIKSLSNKFVSRNNYIGYT